MGFNTSLKIYSFIQTHETANKKRKNKFVNVLCLWKCIERCTYYGIMREKEIKEPPKMGSNWWRQDNINTVQWLSQCLDFFSAEVSGCKCFLLTALTNSLRTIFVEPTWRSCWPNYVQGAGGVDLFRLTPSFWILLFYFVETVFLSLFNYYEPSDVVLSSHIKSPLTGQLSD